jgi:nucleoside-diphosphate-sugar epimerase
MRVLVTGASGRIGSAIAAELASSMDVTGLDLAAGPYTHHQGDIRDLDLLRRALDGVSAVVHTASLHAPHVGRCRDEDFRDINVCGTRDLLSAGREAGIERFVYTSTTSVYGCTTRSRDAAVWADEDLPTHAEDIYDETKLAAEALAQQAAGKDLRVTVLRMSRCFPEPDHLLAFFRLYRGVDARDVARGHHLALTTDTGPFSVFNLSARSPFQPADLRALMNDPWQVIERYHPGAKRWFVDRGWPLPDTIDRVYVTRRAERQLGFVPRYNFDHLLGS